MEVWIREYRDRHPLAAEWARGSTKVSHSEQTQGRVFRMAEQLRVRLEWPTIAPLISTLRSLDEVVDAETPAHGRPDANRAAAAGAVGYKMLFGKLPKMRSHGWPAGFERVDEEDAGLAFLGLERRGFDPIVIDGIDPAAYLWALFEMQQREQSCADVRRLQEHTVHEPRCLAVVPESAAQPASNRSPATASAGR